MRKVFHVEVEGKVGAEGQPMHIFVRPDNGEDFYPEDMLEPYLTKRVKVTIIVEVEEKENWLKKKDGK